MVFNGGFPKWWREVSNRSGFANAAIVFSTVFLVRIIIWKLIAPIELAGDEAFYWNYARKLLAGAYWTGGIEYEEIFILPLWPNVLATFSKIIGGVAAAQIFTIFLASVNSVLFYYLAELLTDRPIAFLAGFLYALFPEHAIFSHYLYAEIMFETFLLVFTLLVFRGIKSEKRMAWFAAAFLVLGIGMMCKHFVFLPHVALLFIFFRRKMAFKYYIVSLLFFLPALMYFSWSASHGRDAFKFLNVPIKNANEWYREGWFLSFNGRSRTDVVSELVERKADISPVLLVKRTGWNFYNLWSPNSYPIARLFHDDTVHHPGIWAFWIAAFYILIICAALFELCLSASSDFKLYVMTNVLILSSMGTVWWLVSRYRTSFLFMFVLFAAQAMLKPFPMMRLSQNRRAAVVFFLLIGLMVHMAFSRMGLIGEWS